MKKILIVISLILSLYASKNVQIIPNNSIYLQNYNNVSNYYSDYLVYKETVEIDKLINNILKNKKLKNYFELDEIGKTKVSTIRLLEQLKRFIEGWEKYTNTEFENNTNEAGILLLLKEKIDNSYYTLPKKIINNVKSSINNLKFFDLIKKLNYKINKFKGNYKDFVEIKKDLYKVFQLYFNSFENLNDKIFTQYNDNIKEKMLKKYRIYLKTNLKKTFEVFKNFIIGNLNKD